MTVTNYKLFAITPKLMTNLVTNPSVELNTTGYTAVGGSVAASTTKARRGVKSLAITPTSGTTDGAYYGTVSLTSGTTYTFSLDVWGVAGIPYKIYFANTSGTLLGTATTFTGIGQWVRVEVTYTAASTASHRLYITKNNNASTAVFYIDGVQCEASSEATTYIDGDQKSNIVTQNVADYYWTGIEHASTSIRTANTRAGGELTDIETYCKVILLEGLGLSSIDNVSVDMTNGNKQYLYSKPKTGYFTLTVSFSGGDLGDIMAKRKGLISLIKPNTTAYNEPLVLRYQGYDDNGVEASEPIDIICNYVSGLDKSPVRRFAHFADITFELYKPTVQLAGEEAAELELVSSLANANYLVYKEPNGAWGVIGSGANDAVYDIKYFNGYYYVAGDFTSFNGTAVNRVCKIDFAGNVTALGDGFDDIVDKLAIAPDGTIYAVGAFTHSGAASIDYTAYFDGSDWQELGGGTGGRTRDIKINNDGDIYCAVWGGSPTGVFILDSGTWSEVGNTGINRKVTFDNDGGIYTTNPTGLSKYNTVTTAWDALITDTDKNGVLIKDNKIYLGTNFITGITTGRIGVHDLDTYKRLKYWDVTGQSGNSGFEEIKIFDNIVYAIGAFDSVDGYTTSDGILTLVNDQFVPIDINFPSTANVYAVEQDARKNLFFGFSTAGTATIPGETSITINGAQTYPIIKVTGPGALKQIRSRTTGKLITFDGLTIQSGETIELDLLPHKLTVTSNFRNSVKSYLVKGSSLDFPLIPGENTIAVLMTDTDSNSEAVIKWQPAYDGLDGAIHE